MAASIGQRLVLLFVTDHTGRIVFLLLGDYFTRTPVYYFSFTNSQVKFTLSILSGDLFDVSIYRGYYALPCHVLKQTYKKKKSNFQDQISFYDNVITRNCFISVISATNFNFVPSLKLTIQKGDVNTYMHVCILYIY